MPSARQISCFLLVFLLAFVLVSMTPSFFLHRRDFDRAYFAHYKDPTPENAAALRAQERINNYIYLSFYGIGAFGLTTLVYGGYGLVRLIGKNVKRTHDSKYQP